MLKVVLSRWYNYRCVLLHPVFFFDSLKFLSQNRLYLCNNFRNVKTTLSKLNVGSVCEYKSCMPTPVIQAMGIERQPRVCLSHGRTAELRHVSVLPVPTAAAAEPWQARRKGCSGDRTKPSPSYTLISWENSGGQGCTIKKREQRETNVQ